MMQWNKLGVVWKPKGNKTWARTHAAIPTPYMLDDETIRVYVTCLDEHGRGRPGFVDVASRNPKEIITISSEPILDIGHPGCFDDNGLMALSVLNYKNNIYMYYAGFELCTKIRYRIFTGLAMSEDGGLTFSRMRSVPVMDRSDEESFFRCGNFALVENDLVRMWYIAGSSWTTIAGKSMPVYDLRYQESFNGIDWKPAGQLSMAITESDEHGFGRPWVVKRGPHDFQLFYSIRRRSLGAYRLGYAESSDGIHWVRKDSEMNLDVSERGFDSQAIMYGAVVSAHGKTYCFYNGNNFGEDGFAVAELLL